MPSLFTPVGLGFVVVGAVDGTKLAEFVGVGRAVRGRALDIGVVGTVLVSEN